MERAGLIGAVLMKQLPTDENGSLRGGTFKSAVDKDRSDGLIPFFVGILIHAAVLFVNNYFKI